MSSQLKSIVILKTVSVLPYRLTSSNRVSSMDIEEIMNCLDNSCPLYSICYLTIIIIERKLPFINRS